MRSFNFSRLARSTCCQRPFHLTPERGDSVGTDPMARALETPGTHLNGLCWETLQPYRESPCPSTHAHDHSGAGIKTGTAALPRPFLAERTREKGACGGAAVLRAQTAEGRKTLIKDRLEVLRLTLNPSGNSVPEYRPRGRGQFSCTVILSDVGKLASDSISGSLE